MSVRKKLIRSNAVTLNTLLSEVEIGQVFSSEETVVMAFDEVSEYKKLKKALASFLENVSIDEG